MSQELDCKKGFSVSHPSYRPRSFKLHADGDENLLNEGVAPEKIHLAMDGKVKKGTIPKYWDGNTAERVVQVVERYLR